MTVLSALRLGVIPPNSSKTAFNLLFKDLLKNNNNVQLLNIKQLNTNATLLQSIKQPASRHFQITPSRYTWQKYKDMFHFYFFLGAIPGLIGVFLVNIYIGPPTLAEIPEGYVPKHWEYQRHPIQQFEARYIFRSFQEDYERALFYVQEEDEKRRMRLLAWRAELLMKERGDFYNYFQNRSIAGKYLRKNRAETKLTYDVAGSRGISEDDVTGPLER